MRPLRYSINITLDGCCDHNVGIPDENTHQHAARTVAEADAMLLGRVTYKLMEDGWRKPAAPGSRPAWTEPFSKSINAIRKYVVSSTLENPGWNTEMIRDDLEGAVRALKQQPGHGILVGGVTLPRALSALGLIDEYEFIVHPRIAGHGPTLGAGLPNMVDLELVSQSTLSNKYVVLKYKLAR
ncbi:MAG: dihydrofolate reductase family protein [Gemmatimonas sp.]